eukprot:TRINITY_DN3729_c0_g1_i1.p1 TRINITY_DN3729_c0_g1~~TRINITY_DN3729_c0_g1_i1.p1  ORF type:complete len:200 (+),score=25.42 TRINITY_DN3729_c0_g1_i1:140-739(+)
MVWIILMGVVVTFGVKSRNSQILFRCLSKHTLRRNEELGYLEMNIPELLCFDSQECWESLQLRISRSRSPSMKSPTKKTPEQRSTYGEILIAAKSSNAKHCEKLHKEFRYLERNLEILEETSSEIQRIQMRNNNVPQIEDNLSDKSIQFHSRNQQWDPENIEIHIREERLKDSNVCVEEDEEGNLFTIRTYTSKRKRLK